MTKCLDMNMTVDEYLYSLEHTTNNLPALFEKWNDLDSTLAEEYESQIWWLLSRVVEVYTQYPEHQAQIMSRILDINIIFSDYGIDFILTNEEWEEILTAIK